MGPSGTPDASRLTQKAIDEFYYGLSKDDYDLLQKLQALPNPTPHQQQTIANLTAKGQRNAILPKEITALQTNLPVFQGISDAILKSQTGALTDLYSTITNKLNPGYANVENTLGTNIAASVGKGLTPEEQQFFAQKLAGNEAAAGRFGSPLSSENMALALTGLDLNQRNVNTENALAFGNAFPNPAAGILSGALGSTPTGAGLTGGSITPTSFSDFESLINSIAGLNYANQKNTGAALGGNIQNIMNMIAGSLTGGMGGGTGFSPSMFTGGMGG